MFYLLHGSTHENVEFEVFIGVASYKHEVLSLLWNYYNCNVILFPSTTFEDWRTDNVFIYAISTEDYEWLSAEIDAARPKITAHLESIKFEPQVVDFIFAVLNCDGPDYAIFDKEFHAKYAKLMERTKLVIK